MTATKAVFYKNKICFYSLFFIDKFKRSNIMEQGMMSHNNTWFLNLQNL